MRQCSRKAHRRMLLSVDIIDTWANFYRLRDELRYDPSFQPSLGETEVSGASIRFGKIYSAETGVQQGRLLFLAYLGAVFCEGGLATVQQWLGALLRLSVSVFKDGATSDLGPTDFEEQSGKRPKVEESLQGFSTQPLQHALPSLSIGYKPTHYNPYSQTTGSLPLPPPPPPPPPSIPPPIQPPPPKGMPSFGNPLAPAQPHLAFLPLFNQTATQRGLSVGYPATFSGPPHAGKWHVSCVGEQKQFLQYRKDTRAE